MANEGSIYRVENGMAVPYANLGSGEDAAVSAFSVGDRFAFGSSFGQLSGYSARATVCGDITTLYFFVFPNTLSLTLGSANQFNSVELCHQLLQSDETDKLLIPYNDTCVTTTVAYQTSNHEALPMRTIYRSEYDGQAYSGKAYIAFYGQRTFEFDDTVEGIIASFSFINAKNKA